MGINEFIQVGNYLKKIRLNLGLTQEQFAEKLGTKRSTYAHYENNDREPGKEIFNALLKNFNINLLEVITENNYTKEVLIPSKKAEDLFKQLLIEFYNDELKIGIHEYPLDDSEIHFLLDHTYSLFTDFIKYRDSNSVDILFIKSRNY